MAKLTARQELFALNFVRTLDATKAARAAGYSLRTAKQQGSRLLTNVALSARIAELKATRFEGAAMAAQEVLEELSLIGRADLADFHDPVTGEALPLSKLPPGASRCIRKRKSKTINRKSETGKPVVETVVELELWDRLSALEMLARYHRMLDGKGSEIDRPMVVNVTFTDATPPAGLSAAKALPRPPQLNRGDD